MAKEIAIVIVTLFLPVFCIAADLHWTNAATDNNISSPGNWLENQEPVDGDTLYFTSANVTANEPQFVNWDMDLAPYTIYYGEGSGIDDLRSFLINSSNGSVIKVNSGGPIFQPSGVPVTDLTIDVDIFKIVGGSYARIETHPDVSVTINGEIINDVDVVGGIIAQGGGRLILASNNETLDSSSWCKELTEIVVREPNAFGSSALRFTGDGGVLSLENDANLYMLTRDPGSLSTVNMTIRSYGSENRMLTLEEATESGSNGIYLEAVDYDSITDTGRLSVNLAPSMSIRGGKWNTADGTEIIIGGSLGSAASEIHGSGDLIVDTDTTAYSYAYLLHSGKTIIRRNAFALGTTWGTLSASSDHIIEPAGRLAMRGQTATVNSLIIDGTIEVAYHPDNGNLSWLYVNNDMTCGDSGNLIWELESDRSHVVEVDGNIQLDGTLTIFDNDGDISTGTYTVLETTGGAISGDFNEVIIPEWFGWYKGESQIVSNQVKVVISAVTPGDLNKDGFINFLDFAEFANAWRAAWPDNWQDWNELADFNEDDVIDIYDLNEFATMWLQ